MLKKDYYYYIVILLLCAFCFSPWLTNKLPPFSDASLHFYTLNYFKQSISQGILPKWDKNLGLGYPYLLFYHGVFYYYFFGIISFITGSEFAYNFGFFLAAFIGMLSCFLLLTRYFKCDKNISLFISSLFVLNYHVLMWLGVWMGSYAFFFAMSLLPLTLLLFFETKTKKHLVYSLVLAVLALSHLIVSALTFFLLFLVLIYFIIERHNKNELVCKVAFLVFGFLLASCWYFPTFLGLKRLGAETVRFDYGSESLDFSTYLMHFGYILLPLSLISTVYFLKNPKKFKLQILFSVLFFVTFLLILGFFKEIINLIPFSKFIQQAWRFSVLHLLSGIIVSACFLNELWVKYSKKIPKDYHESIFLILLFALIALNWNTIQTPSVFFAEKPQIWIDSMALFNSSFRILTLPNTCGAFNVIQQGKYFSACNIEEHHVLLEMRKFKESIDYETMFNENFTNLMKFLNIKYIEILTEFFIPYYDYGKLQENYNKFIALTSYLANNSKINFLRAFDSDKPPSIGFERQWNLDKMQLVVFELKEQPLRYFFADEIKPLGKGCDLKSYILNNSVRLENSVWYYPSDSNGCVFEELKNASIVNSASLKEGLESFNFNLDLKKDAYLVINENNFLNWKAKIDGSTINVLTASPGFIMLKVPAGVHNLVIKQEMNLASILGILVSLISLVLIMILYR